ncbi:MAG: hypothetical protein NTV24_03305 [Candidatus Woesebacteria bacterium]|nr:hypothetical protein [Candidatus Woesebacteria bacterium]
MGGIIASVAMLFFVFAIYGVIIWLIEFIKEQGRMEEKGNKIMEDEYGLKKDEKGVWWKKTKTGKWRRKND